MMNYANSTAKLFLWNGEKSKNNEFMYIHGMTCFCNDVGCTCYIFFAIGIQNFKSGLAMSLIADINISNFYKYHSKIKSPVGNSSLDTLAIQKNLISMKEL